jgi:hypothetical protein
VFQGNAGEFLAATYKTTNRLLVVVYKETDVDGFIITAYFTSQVDRLYKRIVLWEK